MTTSLRQKEVKLSTIGGWWRPHSSLSTLLWTSWKAFLHSVLSHLRPRCYHSPGSTRLTAQGSTPRALSNTLFVQIKRLIGLKVLLYNQQVLPLSSLAHQPHVLTSFPFRAANQHHLWRHFPSPTNIIRTKSAHRR